jgi:hypothetical protein
MMINLPGVRLTYADQRKTNRRVSLTRSNWTYKTSVLAIRLESRSNFAIRPPEGYISNVHAETFTITDRKTGIAMTMEYPQGKSIIHELAWAD